jgi:hypothetical protein
MFIIGEAVIEEQVSGETFCCDLSVCKGGCCTLEGGRGAPLEDREVEEIRKAFPVVKESLPVVSLEVIKRTGLVEGSPGDHSTPCVNQRECVYVYFEEGIARCIFERAFLEGSIKWRKPLSCHLFPIRVRPFGQDFLRYEQIEECHAGRTRGQREQIKLRDFLEEPLVRKYGRSWYETFVDECLARDRITDKSLQPIP